MDLLQSYEAQLDNATTSKSVKKRLLREITKFDEENCSLMSIDTTIENNKTYPTINVIDFDNNLIYSFIIDHSYPFRQPKVRINFRDYYQFLKSNYVPFSEFIKKQYKINCLCCSSMTCSDNWTPANTIIKLIQEIRMFKNYRRNFINKLMADKIKLKYLIDDIDLNSWLF